MKQGPGIAIGVPLLALVEPHCFLWSWGTLVSSGFGHPGLAGPKFEPFPIALEGIAMIELDPGINGESLGEQVVGVGSPP